MKNYQDKYHLTKDESIFLAKKKWDENIYCGMKMENRAVTFPQTKTILNGVNVPNVRLDDIQAILNMRDAWRFLLQTADEPITLEYICKLNEYIARNEALEWGVLRSGSVGISGTEYTPPVPQREQARRELSEILENGSVTQTGKALEVFAWAARSQLFWDGNKRTGMTAANKILLATGAGLLTVKDRDMPEFNERLLRWYDAEEKERLTDFLYENAIEGMK